MIAKSGRGSSGDSYRKMTARSSPTAVFQRHRATLAVSGRGKPQRGVAVPGLSWDMLSWDINRLCAPDGHGGWGDIYYGRGSGTGGCTRWSLALTRRSSRSHVARAASGPGHTCGPGRSCAGPSQSDSRQAARRIRSPLGGGTVRGISSHHVVSGRLTLRPAWDTIAGYR
jgi:hypothetical protein